MHLLGPSLLLLEYLAFSDSSDWNFEHPGTLYSWEGACIWIPCRYTIPGGRSMLENMTLYHNYQYDKTHKRFNGTILYEAVKAGEILPQHDRIRFLGDKRSNCTIHIYPVSVKESGGLGLRMTTKNDKWMEKINLNISSLHVEAITNVGWSAKPRKAWGPKPMKFIWDGGAISKMFREQTSGMGNEIQLKWSLEEPAVTSTLLNTKTVSTQSKLTFQPQWTHHGKNLSCQLWDHEDKQILSEETVGLDVKHVPKLKIEASPRGANVTEGESVTMTCQVLSSNPGYRNIAWLKDRIPLREQETLTLTLPSVTKEMSGKYRCEASNEIGLGWSEEVVLQVYHAPEPSRVEILSSPVKEGDKVEMTCVSLANPPPTNYTWHHNNITMPGRTSKTFQIPAVLLSHAGHYSCSAENRLGPGQVGQEATLDVQYPPKEVTTMIQNPTPIREGDSVTLSCNYNSSNPRVTRYEWNFQGVWKNPLREVLIIEKVRWDASPVSCAACNQWCSWAPSVNLDVQHAPRDVRVQQISTPSEIHSGHRVLLRCNFSSSRPRDVRFFWQKNGIFLKEGQELSFDAISPEDAGNYNCLVNNSIGQTTSEGRILQVLCEWLELETDRRKGRGPPTWILISLLLIDAPRRLRVSISPKDKVIEGKKVVLTCEGDANPPIYRYTWFDQNNQNLQHYDQMLRLDPVKVQQTGAYWCQAINQLGTGRSPPSTLTVYYGPETIGRQVAIGVGFCLAALLLAFWGVKLQKIWKRLRSQQGVQENSSGQSFFVRNKKVRRAPLSEDPHSLGCYNPVMEDAISYATLRFPVGDADAPGTGDAGTPETEGPSLDRDGTVTYSVVQKPRVGDYENVVSESPEDEGIHYSELVHLGIGERPLARESVEYVTLKH
ncbi:B-cell receptor CD22 isoform X2 [Suricata suricatta]|uniref:B-cell receptor CD22 isoform X2 n=1 Tax=Suricata suricatta TaxID=37032 RepID=UPI001155A8AD|nr:B-cell receptor CD22 isoform X2 [Suricata suricatta]